MNIRLSLSDKILLGILLILMAVIYAEHHSSKNVAPGTAVNTASPNTPAPAPSVPTGLPSETSPASGSGTRPRLSTNAAQNQTIRSGGIANPIPTDAEVMRRIALRADHEARAYALLSAHNAIAAQVQEEAAATQYQPVPPPKGNGAAPIQPSADTMEKLKNFQIGASH